MVKSSSKRISSDESTYALYSFLTIIPLHQEMLYLCQ